MLDITTTTDRSRLTVGLDMGDRFTQVCVLDEDGEVVEEARVRIERLPTAYQRAPGFLGLSVDDLQSGILVICCNGE